MSWKEVKTNTSWKTQERKNLAQQVQADKSIVMTNPDMAKYLLSLIQFEDNDIVLEPCKGDGAFYNNFPDNVERRYCEIDEDIDFTDDIEYSAIVGLASFGFSRLGDTVVTEKR